MKKVLLLVVLALAAGCPNPGPSGNPDLSAPVPTNFTSINNEIFKTSCANFSVCHSTQGASLAGNLNLQLDTSDMSPNDPYTALVGVVATNTRAKGEGKKRVDPCNPANSFLLTKLRLMTDTDPKTDYGAHMPAGGNPLLPAQQVQAISDWISRGAFPNEPSSVSGTTCQISSPDAAAH